MRILLTGATGAIGPHVMAALEQAHTLTLFSRRSHDTPHTLVAGDLTSPDDCLRAAEGAEAIVHLAAYSMPNADAFRFNLLSTYALLEAARQTGVARFIFASTICVYGHCFITSGRTFPLQFLPVDEAHPCLPEDNYGLSKHLCEAMLATYSQVWGLRTAALRLCWVWRPKELQWRRDMPALDLARYAPYFWSYVDARDAAAAFRLALEAPDLPAHGVYNISAADHMAVESSADLMAQFYAGAPLRGPLDARAAFFDWRRAQRAFGFQPEHSWRAD